MRNFVRVAGPGIVVMLADTDAGSVITAAQSGTSWGFKLLWLQLLLIPILYVVQELTVRLGVVTGRGHGELIREVFGFNWALVSVSTLGVACLGALFTEFSGIAGVGLMFGIPSWLSMSFTAAGMILMVWSGSYRTVEKAAIAIGAFELVFFIVAWRAAPSAEMFASGFAFLPWRNGDYLYLVAANIGAVVMPWMIFYQQSAIVDKGLRASDLPAARLDTAVGALLTQAVMSAVLIAAAASLSTENHRDLRTVQEIALAIVPYLAGGRTLFALGMTGAALVAAIVVSLTIAWGFGEVFGFKRSLEHHPREAPWFYGIFTLMVIISAAVVASGVNLVDLSIGVEAMNALLLPIVLGFLFLLARKALPEEHRLSGAYSIFVAAILLLTTGMGIWGVLYGLFS